MEYLFTATAANLFILFSVLLISPIVLRLASSQNKQSKIKTKTIFISILLLQLILGFFNWENFSMSGRSGFELSLANSGSFLGLFFTITLLQIALFLLNKSYITQVVVLNFVNSVIIFMGMIRISNSLGIQAVSLASVSTIFLVLIGNVVGLTLANTDKNIFKKYPFLK